ncbi:MAG: bifunctional phosphoribosylaminoimidazolecarboxamide formyltransferase/IMP cyclohydrolase [Bacteroidales bacterium]|nr:bifunctional phosphoribosylaminoimidazolecarboxamide formyltransferase/IMP cyclohydrolase [Bacteroidales bacterium]
MKPKKIKSALISVYHKEGIAEIIKKLNELGVNIFSTGGTHKYIEELGIKAVSVEDMTSFPSVFGGRVKTLHPNIFGGILARRDNETDKKELEKYKIKEIDLVIVDLYPFEETVANTNDEKEIIEKIDIGGISLIRAAAKNFEDVVVVPSAKYYKEFHEMLNGNKGEFSLEQRKTFAGYAFDVTSGYDTAIFNYFNKDNETKSFKYSVSGAKVLRYGENPHQKGIFYGDFAQMFEQLNGKELSYNNLLDVDAAVNIIDDFKETTFAVIKHNNPCGLASRPKLIDAWKDALAGDPVSAFGGILITNETIDNATAEEINKLFFEVIIASAYENNALNLLKSKKNRIILQRKNFVKPATQFRTILNGMLEQQKDTVVIGINDMKQITDTAPSQNEYTDLEFADKVVKHTKSNAIVLAKNKQLLAGGAGQTSRVDALKQAIAKAKEFKFDLNGAVMASDAFFPFADCVEIAHKAGITAIIQPGGSINDKDSIEYCNKNKVAMVLTGIRHFKH